MKFAMVGDVHFDESGGSKHYQKNIKKFFDNVFFPKMYEQNIKNVLQTGDMFHVRKLIHTDSLYNAKECFFDVLQYNDIKLDMILGNHDIYLRESLRINTPELVLGEYSNITIHKKCKTIEFDGIFIDMIPWICDENKSEVFDFIEKSKSDYCFLHPEFVGFSMSKYQICQKGLDISLFSKYKSVWCGHFHKQSKDKNIHYLGTPTQDTWDSFDEIKGFHIFDTESKELEFVPNPYNLFEKLSYNDESEIDGTIDITDKFVRVIVEKNTDNKKFEKYLDELWKLNPIDIKVVDNFELDNVLETNTTIDELDSGSFNMISYLSEYTINSKNELDDVQKNIIKETYEKLFKMNVEEN